MRTFTLSRNDDEVRLVTASSASRPTHNLLPTSLKILSEHRIYLAIPTDFYHPKILRHRTTNHLNCCSGWNSHYDSLFAAGINRWSWSHQTKTLADYRRENDRHAGLRLKSSRTFPAA